MREKDRERERDEGMVCVYESVSVQSPISCKMKLFKAEFEKDL